MKKKILKGIGTVKGGCYNDYVVRQAVEHGNYKTLHVAPMTIETETSNGTDNVWKPKWETELYVIKGIRPTTVGDVEEAIEIVSCFASEQAVVAWEVRYVVMVVGCWLRCFTSWLYSLIFRQ